MKKILVLGSRGMAGHMITLNLLEYGHEVNAYTRNPFIHCTNILGDVFDEEHFKNVLIGGDYDVVINCIGLLNESANNNKSLATYLNSYLPHLIADTLRHSKTKLIHLSTDCIFSGNTGPYNEMSLPDGLTFYDRSKALGEVVDGRNLTFRNSIIGPDMHLEGIGLFNWFMKQTKPINGFSRVIWSGVTTLTLSKAICQALDDDLCGLFHLVNNSYISKHQLLCLFNENFKGNELIVFENAEISLDKSLISTRSDFSFQVPTYEIMIEEMRDWVINRKHLYPHYFNR
jgi:dTDP-4-dehydrorhamnose reductase